MDWAFSLMTGARAAILVKREMSGSSVVSTLLVWTTAWEFTAVLLVMPAATSETVNLFWSSVASAMLYRWEIYQHNELWWLTQDQQILSSDLSSGLMATDQTLSASDTEASTSLLKSSSSSSSSSSTCSRLTYNTQTISWHCCTAAADLPTTYRPSADIAAQQPSTPFCLITVHANSASHPSPVSAKADGKARSGSGQWYFHSWKSVSSKYNCHSSTNIWIYPVSKSEWTREVG